jgi:hypothetical protein
MNAGVSGDYPAIMRFVNGLERSQTFFVIRAMALTGQQTGTVNLRLEVSTWLRPADAVGIPIVGAPSTTPSADGSGAGDAGSDSSPTASVQQDRSANPIAGELALVAARDGRGQ